jgi:hypothetical protein
MNYTNSLFACIVYVYIAVIISVNVSWNQKNYCEYFLLTEDDTYGLVFNY